jgi:hypothetical protein
MSELDLEIRDAIEEGVSYGTLLEMFEGVVRAKDLYALWQEYHGADSLDDSMDGDAASALTSAGWGTDEDYGYFGEA